ncbi:MAG TPA: FAD-binding oxidoreductase [Chthoniobacteraceae bacterium]|jgi:FAD/FMN-containing dehydrogenase
MQTRRAFLRTSLTAASAFAANSPGAEPENKPAKSASRSDRQEPVVYLSPPDAGYGEARRVYNAGLLTRPQIIARCSAPEGVQQAIQKATEKKWRIAVKAGGHSFEGFSLNDDGIVIDVSPMRQLALDAKTGVLTAGAGCRLEELNRFLLAKGRFLPAGSCATVGLAGLTLGGGYGLFARKWGLTCDHLRSVSMADGNGKLHDSTDEPELLWACRGGGNGHFGVVTGMTFETRPAPRGFSSWKYRIYKLDAKKAADLLEVWFAASALLPRDAFSAWVMNGSQVTILVTTIGARDDKGLVSACAKLARFSKRTTTAGPTPLSKALTWYYGDPAPAYFKNASAGYYRGMDDVHAALPAVFGEVLSVPGLIYQVNTMGGAIAEGAESAYPHRAFPYLGERQAYWTNPSHAERCTAAAKRMGDVLAKAGIDRHYANYPDLAFTDWPTAYYGAENYRKLQTLKSLYDSDDRIRHAQSVRLPAPA